MASSDRSSPFSSGSSAIISSFISPFSSALETFGSISNDVPSELSIPSIGASLETSTVSAIKAAASVSASEKTSESSGLSSAAGSSCALSGSVAISSKEETSLASISSCSGSSGDSFPSCLSFSPSVVKKAMLSIWEASASIAAESSAMDSRRGFTADDSESDFTSDISGTSTSISSIAGSPAGFQEPSLI